ncbi:MAG TPA: phosphatase [Clostridiaceae bacterium]|nr:phosphatase [Clostridiaceae bacterium]
MKLVADCHFHTISSGHAYSTLYEYAKEAEQKGLKLIGMTDHGPRMPGGPHRYHFDNLKVIPGFLFGVEIYKGIEANIIDFDGSTDTENMPLNEMDIVISSFHSPCLKPSTKEENTRAIIRSLDNKYVNIIGHPDDSRIPIDLTELVKAASETGALIEINNSSLRPTSFRQNARENYMTLLEECYKNKVYVIINSDAHIHTDIGASEEALELIKKAGFPEELVANTDLQKLKQKLAARRR